jgi:hypothetical protein
MIDLSCFLGYYQRKEIPPHEYFCSLKDSPSQVEEKKIFWFKIKSKPWEFMEQMRRYLFFEAKHLLAAGLKVIKISYEIQKVLQLNYPGKEMDIGCLFASPNSGAFMYTLMMHYSTVDLDGPIFSTRGVASTLQLTVQIMCLCQDTFCVVSIGSMACILAPFVTL